jgi:hypothetical protein
MFGGMNCVPRTVLMAILVFTACSSPGTAPPGNLPDGGSNDQAAADTGGTPDLAPVDQAVEAPPVDLVPVTDLPADPVVAETETASPVPDAAVDRLPTDGGQIVAPTWALTGCNVAQIMYPMIDSNNGRFPPGSCPPPEAIKPVCPGNSKLMVMAVTASSFETAFPHPPAYAIDEHMTTRWSSNVGPTGWIALDLGSEKTFQRLFLTWELAHGSGYDIVTSNDGQTWSPLAMVRGGDGFQDIIDVDGRARFVRMNGITRGSTGNIPQCCAPAGTLHGYSLFDFTVCGQNQ